MSLGVHDLLSHWYSMCQHFAHPVAGFFLGDSYRRQEVRVGCCHAIFGKIAEVTRKSMCPQ